MSATLLRNSVARTGLRAAGSRRAGLAGTSFVRTKATLPDLACMSILISVHFLWVNWPA